MKVKLVSDLHLEFSDLEIPNDGCDILILAGDILIADYLYRYPNPELVTRKNDLYGPKYRAYYFRKFLERVSLTFKHVIFIAGNHEFYNGKFFKSIQVLKDYCKEFKNIHYLENETLDIEHVTFVGCTLWTSMGNANPLVIYQSTKSMNDYAVIRNDEAGHRRVRPMDTIMRHRKSLKFIEDAVANFDSTLGRKLCVITHHAPSFKSSPPEYINSLTTGAYCTELGNYIAYNPQIAYWFHGHTHHAQDYVIGDTRIVCNPRGYQSRSGSENTGFNLNLVIDIPPTAQEAQL